MKIFNVTIPAGQSVDVFASGAVTAGSYTVVFDTPNDTILGLATGNGVAPTYPLYSGFSLAVTSAETSLWVTNPNPASYVDAGLPSADETITVMVVAR